MNEKGAIALANTFTICPSQLQIRIDDAFVRLAPDPVRLAYAVDVLDKLLRDVDTLVTKKL